METRDTWDVVIYQMSTELAAEPFWPLDVAATGRVQCSSILSVGAKFVPLHDTHHPPWNAFLGAAKPVTTPWLAKTSVDVDLGCFTYADPPGTNPYNPLPRLALWNGPAMRDNSQRRHHGEPADEVVVSRLADKDVVARTAE